MKTVKAKGIGRNSKIILFISVIIACMVGFGVYQYLYTQKTMVYIYNDDYVQGDLVTKEMFASTQLDSSTWNALAGTGNRYVTADDIIQSINAGECLLVDVAKYTLASANQFVSSGGTAIESRLAKNMVSVEIPSDKVSGLSAAVRIGSRLNVITGYSIESTKNTDLIFQDLLVIDVIQDANGVLKSVYVEVEPTESVQLIHSIMFESVAVSILKPGNYIPVNGSEASYKKNYTSDVPDMYTGTMSQNENLPPQQTNGVTLGQGQEVQN